MTDRTVSVKLKAEVAQFKTAMADAGQSVEKTTQKTADQVAKQKQAIKDVTTGALVAGGAMTAFAALAVRKFADFDQAMSYVAATGDEAKASIDDLRDAALEAGKRTVYSASEAAGALETLAKAGVATKDVLAGGLTGALDLAAASGMAVADASEAMATSMNQFGLKGKDASHIADVLAASAGKAMGDVSDMAGAMKFVGPVAHQMGVSLEETAGTVALLAQQGIIGEQAGTSLRGMLSSLTSPSKIAADEIANLGINVYDANGKFVGFAGVAQQLQTTMANLTNAERDQALGRIFGNEQITTARILMASGAADVNKWTTAVNDSGYAADVAATRLDNLKGDWEQLSGSFETALIKMGSGSNGLLRGITQDMTGVVNAFADAPSAVQNVTLAIVGGGGLTILGLAGLAKLVVRVGEVKTALETLHVSAKTAGVAVGSIGGALAIAAVAMSVWSDAQALATQRAASFRTALESSTDAIDANLRSVVANDIVQKHGWWIFKADSLADSAKRIGLSLNDVTDAVLGNASAMERVKAATNYSNGSANTTDALNVMRGVDALAASYRDQVAAQKDVNAVTGEGAAAQTDAAGATATLTAAQEAQVQATKEQQDALDKWRKMVADSDGSFIDLGQMYDAIVQKNKDLAQASADATKSADDSWQTFYDGQTVSAADYIASLQKQVDAQNAWEQNMVDLANRVNTTMTADMRDAANGMIDELMNLGPDGAAQVQLLHDMSDAELAKVVTLYQEKGAKAASDFVAAIETAKSPMLPEPQITPDNGAVRDFLARTQGYLNSNPIIVRSLLGDLNGAASGSGRMGTYATGGHVSGPGTSTSDSIPALLSNGEYVVKAAAVNQYGRSFFDGLNAQRFATGGSVGYSSTSAPAQVDSSVNVRVGQLVATDPRAAIAELGHELTFAMAGRPR